jgi:hypothetical protein
MLSLHHTLARAAYVGDVADCVAAVRRGASASRTESSYA